MLFFINYYYYVLFMGGFEEKRRRMDAETEEEVEHLQNTELLADYIL